MTDILSLPLPSFARSYINHLGVINKSPNTQKAYAQELLLFFNFLCQYISDFPSSPTSLTLDHINQIQHNDIEAYLCWALTNRNNGVRALARKQAVIRSFYYYL